MTYHLPPLTVTVIGKSGTGKTLLIHLLSNFLAEQGYVVNLPKTGMELADGISIEDRLKQHVGQELNFIEVKQR